MVTFPGSVISVVIHLGIALNPSVAKLLREIRDCSFSHSEDLFQGLRNGSILLHAVPSESPLPVSHYAHIWQTRLELCDRNIRQRSETDHKRRLRKDMQSLVDGFESGNEELCDLWIFTKLPHFVYAIWIGNPSRTVFGCVRSVDNRLISRGNPMTNSGAQGKTMDNNTMHAKPDLRVEFEPNGHFFRLGDLCRYPALDTSKSNLEIQAQLRNLLTMNWIAILRCFLALAFLSGIITGLVVHYLPDTIPFDWPIYAGISSVIAIALPISILAIVRLNLIDTTRCDA